MRERQFGGGERLVILGTEELFKEHLGPVLRGDRRAIAAPRKRHRKRAAKAGLAHRAEHERRKARGAAMKARELLIERGERLTVAHRVHAGKQATARSVTAAVSSKSGHHRALVLEWRERLERWRERVVPARIRWREAANLHTQPPISKHGAPRDFPRRHGARGGDVLRLRAHGFEPGQRHASPQAFKKRAALHAPLVGLDVHG